MLRGQRFYTIGSLIGLVAVVGVAIQLLGLQFLEDLFYERANSIPVGAGAFACIALGWWLDRQYVKTNFLRAVFFAWVIFALGTVVGSFANATRTMLPFDQDAYRHEWRAWFITPLWWFGIIGMPCSLVVGALYWLLNLAIKRIR